MNDRQRQLRKLLEGYRARAAAITIEMPELAALAARHEAGGAVAGQAAPVAERPMPAAESPASVAERPAPVAERPDSFDERPVFADREPEASGDAPAQGQGFARAGWLAAALVVAVAAAWLGQTSRFQKRNIHRVMSLPLTRSVGLARHGAVFYSFDRSRKMMATIDPATGKTLSLKSFPNDLAGGLAASTDKLWSAGRNGVVFEHGLNDDYAVRRTFANPDRRPSALHWDGSHLWIADARTNSLYEYTMGESLVPARQFTLPPGMTPAGLQVEKDRVWVLDAATLTIHRFRLRALLEPIDSMELKPWVAAPRRPTGLVVDDQALWISTDEPPELHRFDLRHLSWRAEL